MNLKAYAGANIDPDHYLMKWELEKNYYKQGKISDLHRVTLM